MKIFAFDTNIPQENINDPFTDAYTNAFLPVVDALQAEAASAADYDHPDRASDLYRRAAVVLRIARFPYVSPHTRPDNALKRAAFERQKDVYMRAAGTWKPAINEVLIPHTHGTGLDGAHIPLYVRVPEEAGAAHRVPAVILLTGLDGYRPDNSQRTHEIVNRGWGAVICEIPGTADCPADPADPASPDRLLSSVLEYMGQREEFDMGRVAVWGLSAGGFYAIRAACTHRERLVGSVAHGPGSHHFLGGEWLSRVNDHEYPFT